MSQPWKRRQDRTATAAALALLGFVVLPAGPALAEATGPAAPSAPMERTLPKAAMGRPDLSSLLLTVERQVMAGHVTSPPGDNVTDTLQQIVEAVSTAGPEEMRQARHVAADLKERAQEARAAGNAEGARLLESLGASFGVGSEPTARADTESTSRAAPGTAPEPPSDADSDAAFGAAPAQSAGPAEALASSRPDRQSPAPRPGGDSGGALGTVPETASGAADLVPMADDTVHPPEAGAAPARHDTASAAAPPEHGAPGARGAAPPPPDVLQFPDLAADAPGGVLDDLRDDRPAPGQAAELPASGGMAAPALASSGTLPLSSRPGAAPGPAPSAPPGAAAARLSAAAGAPPLAASHPAPGPAIPPQAAPQALAGATPAPAAPEPPASNAPPPPVPVAAVAPGTPAPEPAQHHVVAEGVAQAAPPDLPRPAATVPARPAERQMAALEPPHPTPPVPPPRTDPAAARPSVPPLSPALVSVLLRRGQQMLAQGDVSAARLLFERAAPASARAATGAGMTYDPAFLAEIGAVGGIQPDPAAAMSWYRRAAAMGDEEAERRLARLRAAAGGPGPVQAFQNRGKQ